MPRFVRDTVGPSSRGPRRTRTFDSSGPLSPIGVPAPMPGTWANAGAAYRLAIRATATAECLDVIKQKRLCERGTRCGFTIRGGTKAPGSCLARWTSGLVSRRSRMFETEDYLEGLAVPPAATATAPTTPAATATEV